MKNMIINFEVIDKDENHETETYYIDYKDGLDLDNQLMKIGDRIARRSIDFWEISRSM